jgi:hypothetical protein
MEYADYARRVAAEVVRALDGLQENVSGGDDGIDLDTRLGSIQKKTFPQLWIWPARVDSAWFLGRMQKVARSNTPSGASTAILFPGTFATSTTPGDVFEKVLAACKLADWYKDLSAAQRAEIAG